MEPCPRGGAFSACLFLSRTTQIWSTEVKSRHYGFGLRRIRKPLRQCSWIQSFPWKENYFPYRIIFSIGAVVLLHGEEGAVSAGGALQKTHSLGVQQWRVISGWTNCSQSISEIWISVHHHREPDTLLCWPELHSHHGPTLSCPKWAHSYIFFFFHFEKCVKILRKRRFFNKIYIYIFKITKPQIQNKNNSLVLLRVFVAQALHVLLTHWMLTITLWSTDPIFQLRRL